MTSTSTSAAEPTGFLRAHQSQFSTLYRAIDVVIILACLQFSLSVLSLPLTSTEIMLALGAAVGFMLTSESLELYRSWRFSRGEDLVRTVTLSWAITCGLSASVLIYFAPPDRLMTEQLVVWALVTWSVMAIWRLMYRQFLFYLRRAGYNSRRAGIVGLTDAGLALANEIAANDQLGTRFIGFFDDRDASRLQSEGSQLLLGKVDDAIELARQHHIDLLYIALPLKAEQRIMEIIKRCGDTTIDVQLIPNLMIYRMLHARWHRVGQIQTMSVVDSPLLGFSAWLKRVEDLVLSSLILLMIALPMLAIALGIKLTSPGPVLFKQDRYGIDGRRIRVWKFRSMKVMDNGSVVKQATKGDPRITRFGSFLRRTSLDELPQFFNVLQGSMSIVGPRPHAVAHNEEFRTIVDGYMLRHKVKPGITGWAQINGWRGETNTIEKMEGRIAFDLAYIRNWSIWFDLKIVLMTVFKGFIGKNAY
ncbi:undecaprenyl-phosphate glucose phosphotransferase [Neiella marina]|uniref:Undecaprenyl-phosphate glucose phosphotransferase n=1 Tax=Neiella marina TaxID=508461 RepID=A0A8J2XMH8_9GAMM|nr:undecaprenyl-phosphate glucose phosphotransferase [Neiella marina]GGA64579.1 undecaprenyl-phosphate glucose phosphotransferase [Neiella marina]